MKGTTFRWLLSSVVSAVLPDVADAAVDTELVSVPDEAITACVDEEDSSVLVLPQAARDKVIAAARAVTITFLIFIVSSLLSDAMHIEVTTCERRQAGITLPDILLGIHQILHAVPQKIEDNNIDQDDQTGENQQPGCFIHKVLALGKHIAPFRCRR